MEDSKKNPPYVEDPDPVTEEETQSEETAAPEEEKREEPAKEPKETRKERKELKEIKAAVKELVEENEKLKKEAAETENKYMRMMAEYDNFRKRSAREREGVYTEAVADALKEILPVKDVLEMAVAYDDGEKILEGVKMTLTKFDESLKKLGVEEVGKEGDTFDPELHNAVMHVDDESLGENVIAQVLMKGYKKGDKMLRHAMVKVAN